MRFRRHMPLWGQSRLGGLFIIMALVGGTIDDRNLPAVAEPAEPEQLRPVARVPRDLYATVCDLGVLLYPGVDTAERAAGWQQMTTTR
jgi:hypothetical protein